jgi:hypothetical protein
MGDGGTGDEVGEGGVDGGTGDEVGEGGVDGGTGDRVAPELLGRTGRGRVPGRVRSVVLTPARYSGGPTVRPVQTP